VTGDGRRGAGASRSTDEGGEPCRRDPLEGIAAVALSYLAAADPVPWNAEVANSINYRALVPTLLGQSAGLLDYH